MLLKKLLNYKLLDKNFPAELMLTKFAQRLDFELTGFGELHKDQKKKKGNVWHRKLKQKLPL